MESLYPGFAQTAEEEGSEIAEAYRNIAIAEGQHSKVYTEFANRIKEDKMFKSEEEIVWQCRVCGFILRVLSHLWFALRAHPRAHFQRLSDAPIAPSTTDLSFARVVLRRTERHNPQSPSRVYDMHM